MGQWHEPAERIGGTAVRVALCIFSSLACITAPNSVSALAQATNTSNSPCKMNSTVYEGWQAEEISNRWVKLTVVPQLGGRVMQVAFDGHPYLFVNPKYKGQYFPPSEGAEKGRWFNYGGDKIWPMPEGTQDEHHWPGPISDALDDGNYVLKRISGSPRCTARLEGPPDARTGLQYSREIVLENDSPEIQFHATMKNSSTRPIQWAMQSVTQYDTRDPQNPESYNREFWAFAAANAHSRYMDRYHIRSGLADDPSYAVNNDMFRLHWLPLENEVWLDSDGEWLAVVDGTTQYGMVERFHYFPGAEYPGEATVIFYKNGAALELDAVRNPKLAHWQLEHSLRYMEAELNSPIVKLEPGADYSMDTNWFPVRMGKEFTGVTSAGVIGIPLRATRSARGVLLTGSFGVFAAGKIEARLYDNRDAQIAAVPMQTVDPKDLIELHREINVPRATVRIAIHLIDQQGKDHGPLEDTRVTEVSK